MKFSFIAAQARRHTVAAHASSGNPGLAVSAQLRHPNCGSRRRINKRQKPGTIVSQL